MKSTVRVWARLKFKHTERMCQSTKHDHTCDMSSAFNLTLRNTDWESLVGWLRAGSAFAVSAHQLSGKSPKLPGEHTAYWNVQGCRSETEGCVSCLELGSTAQGDWAVGKHGSFH